MRGESPKSYVRATRGKSNLFTRGSHPKCIRKGVGNDMYCKQVEEYICVNVYYEK